MVGGIAPNIGPLRAEVGECWGKASDQVWAGADQEWGDHRSGCRGLGHTTGAPSTLREIDPPCEAHCASAASADSTATVDARRSDAWRARRGLEIAARAEAEEGVRPRGHALARVRARAKRWRGRCL